MLLKHVKAMALLKDVSQLEKFLFCSVAKYFVLISFKFKMLIQLLRLLK